MLSNARGDVSRLRDLKSKLAAQYVHTRAADATPAATRRIPTSDPVRNVQAVAIGHKVSDGRLTGDLAVKIYVAKKFAPGHIAAEHFIAPEYGGLPTDIEESGFFTALTAVAPPAVAIDPKARIRPAQPGCSIGFEDPAHAFVMAGTFGALVHDAAGTRFVLSNNHVLADENALAAGAPIFQPGLLDGGTVPADAIARLTRFVPLDPAGPNTVDCAIAEVVDNASVTNAILGGGPPKGVAAADHDMVVEKTGRTTGYTAGRISSTEADVKVSYEIGTLSFTNQILIAGLNGPFSAAGDSGSLILERDTQDAVGLLFAGSPAMTIANHLVDVLTALGVTLV
jgi:hypothetical protein